MFIVWPLLLAAGSVMTAQPPVQPQIGEDLDIPLNVPGSRDDEVKALAPVERMTGAELARLLRTERLDGRPLETIPYGKRMKNRALERLGELRYAPGIPELIQHIDFYYPPAGEPYGSPPGFALGSHMALRPAPKAIRAFGALAAPQVREALKHETDGERWLYLTSVLHHLGEKYSDR